MVESNAERWARIRAQRADPLGQLADAVYEAFRPRRQGVDAVAMLTELATGVDRITARRAAQEARNGPRARAAFDHWQRARADFAAEREYEFEPELSPLIAATMHINRATPRIY